MAGLNVQLTGSLVVAPSQDCYESDNSATRALVLLLKSETQGADACIGQGRYQVSGVVNEPLAFPASFSARLFVLRILDAGLLDVTVTYATSGPSTLHTNGLIVLEQQFAERITGVTVTGSATFEWVATGPNTV